MAERTGLAREFDYYLAHQDELVEQYDGKVIAIKGGIVLGVYDTHLKAFTEMAQLHERGTFLIQHVSAGDEAYTATFITPGVRPGE